MSGGTFTLRLKDVIDLTGGDIGLNEYPIFEESYRAGLNKKIIDHYYNCEIGVETIDMFLLSMKRKMNEIMPLHNAMYKAKVEELDPFLTHRMDSTSTSSGESESSSTSSAESENTTDSTSKARAVGSETPQVRLSGEEDYATNAQDSASESHASGSGTDTTTSSGAGSTAAQGTDHSEGFSGRSMASLLLEYRQAFVNVDLEIINDLEPLFMSVWDNGDEYFFTRPVIGFPYYGFGWF